MKPIELYRVAVAEIGDVSAAELSAHLEKKHGLKILPAFIPLYRATLHELEKNGQSPSARKPIPQKQPAQVA